MLADVLLSKGTDMLYYGMLLRDKISNFFDLVNNNKTRQWQQVRRVYMIINATARHRMQQAGSAATCHCYIHVDVPGLTSFFLFFGARPSR